MQVSFAAQEMSQTARTIVWVGGRLGFVATLLVGGKEIFPYSVVEVRYWSWGCDE